MLVTGTVTVHQEVQEVPTLAVVGIPRVRGTSLCFTRPEVLPVSRGNDALVKVWGDTGRQPRRGVPECLTGPVQGLPVRFGM